jgi:hypothetical protein
VYSRHEIPTTRAGQGIEVFARFLRTEAVVRPYSCATRETWSPVEQECEPSGFTSSCCNRLYLSTKGAGDSGYGFNHPKISSYLAGLWEGDGHIVLPKRSALDQRSKATTPCLAITFPEKDLPLVEGLAQKYRGWIRRKIKERAIVYTITKQSDLLNIVGEMNGFLRTPKIYELNKLLFFLNEKCKANLQIHSEDYSSLSENYWLAGFIDADGGFQIRHTSKVIDPFTKK